MRSTTSDIECHVFVCTNQKTEGKPCCAPHGGSQLREELKKLVSLDNQLSNKVRINASGCLDKCKEGVAIAIYPQGKWFVEANPNNAKALLEEIRKNLNK